MKSKSREIYKQLQAVIPGGVNSPVRSCKGLIDPPMIADHAKGDLIYDADGNEYIDYCGSWGSLIHGHAHPKILSAAYAQMQKGTSFGITTEIEGVLARKVVDKIDSVDKIRFVSSGTEATMSAARLARGYTSREILVKFTGNYHGHADLFLVKAGSGVLSLNTESSSKGVPAETVKNTVSLTYNDIEGTRAFIREHASKIAAVILEPIAGNMGVVRANNDFIYMLREETSKAGSLLIFDEVITGFRIGVQGAQSIYNVSPDLTCFGKIVGGGFPAAAFGGREEIMNCLAPLGGVYQAGTLSGNPVAMQAGYQALSLLEEPGFYSTLEEKTEIITVPLKELIERENLNMCLQQVGSMFTLFFGVRKVENMDDAKSVDSEKFAELFRYLYENGVYAPPSPHEAWFVSMAHTEKHLEKTRDLMLDFIRAEVPEELCCHDVKGR